MTKIPEILIFGKNGQLGFELQRSISVFGNIIAVDIEECDLTNQLSIRSLIQRTKPDVIINASAHTAVDAAESQIDLAFALNSEAPKIMAEEALKINALLVHYSTDYVFDGTKQGLYSETDKTNPQSVYGKSKLSGELSMAQNCQKYLIFRTSWVFGVHGKNFLKTILNVAQSKDRLDVVADQIGAPTSASLLADITAHILAKYLFSSKNNFAYGLYHLTANGHVSWCDFAKFIVEKAALCGFKCRTKAEEIYPISTSNYPRPAPRPLNSRLDTEKLRRTFQLTLPDWQQDAQRIIQLLSCYVLVNKN